MTVTSRGLAGGIHIGGSARPRSLRRLITQRVVRRGKEFSLRWIMIHMIEEYARHNGHADLLRERIDGTVGD